MNWEQKQVIVSLTSFPEAISYAVRAIQSVLEGSVKPDKIILYLTASQFPCGKIPHELQALKDKNPLFEIRFYEENIRSYTKLIPALKDFPEAIIVTVDDDILYKKSMLQSLLRLHKKYPDAIISHRCRHLRLNTPYRKWKRYKGYRFILKSLRPKFGNFQTGVGGVLYPPNSLKAEMLDSKLFMETAPTVDDVWFWAAAVANRTKIAPVPFGNCKPIDLRKPQEICLRNTNISGMDVNRAVLESIFEKYPVIKERIVNEKNQGITQMEMREKQVIVSLTSFPAAIFYAVRAIQSVLEGSVKPDKIILYLTASQFPCGKIPHELQALKDKNPLFEIRFYEENIRSYTKLIPALKDFPDAVIVTIDDDVWYNKNMLRDLLRLHRQVPDAIIAHRAKRLKLNAPYRQWKKYRWYSFLTKKLPLKFSNIQTGVGGVLYPLYSLKAEMLDSKLFKEIAPTTDDIWFWAAAVANGTKILPYPFGRHNKPRGLKKPKELSLKIVNFKSKIDLNRAALEKILEKYPVIRQRIDSEK